MPGPRRGSGADGGNQCLRPNELPRTYAHPNIFLQAPELVCTVESYYNRARARQHALIVNQMRECIFCQGRANTEEDVWPQWLTKLFPPSDISFREGEIGGRILPRWQSKTTKLLKVRCVCQKCNNGWMSQTENAIKPVIKSILDNRMKAVDASSQVHIAVWAIKTAMTLEALNRHRAWFYTNDQRHEFEIATAIPEGTSIWIAKCKNQPNILSIAKDLWTARGENEVHGYLTTMAFGSLALQVMSSRPHVNSLGTPITFQVSEGPWKQVLLQVWPLPHISNSQQWPLNQGLNGDWGLEVLANRFNAVKP